MNSASTARVKQKIRYDINVHREQYKQVLLNSRRGVIVEEEENNEFTIEVMTNLALEIKNKKQITVKQLRLLRNGFLCGTDFVSVFIRVQGAADSLLHLATSKNEEVQLAAIECFCNMSLGDKRICLKLTKLITSYLMMYINHLNYNISAMCIWTLGNLSDSSPGSCKIIQSHKFFDALVDRLQNSFCDEVIFNTFYALRLFLKNYLPHLQIEDLNKLLLACYERLNTWKESFWIVYQISCYRGMILHHSECMEHLLNALNEDIIDITCLVPILRTFSNIIALDSTGHSALVLLYALLREKGFNIRNILINNRDINLNYECAWLLGNAFNALKITELNGYDHLTQTETFDEICSYLLV
ncbi:PREDICTED: uncharacterized protein LOC107168868 [Diuraphis noxia]|uniref:uncharacterized protein LOC107168868 n=1 Tax=Diuraphis noxia TaxID=143948 RepID=UPI00076371BA|nr:PREDICTED: uncharacterized protein LOC107168868 [Diuraphis noxia]XP_015373894.1 PREDICTED: uncharacterized protein LOC107168868 [Diuraphis noxia]